MAVIAVGRYEFLSSRRDDSTLAIATANFIPHACTSETRATVPQGFTLLFY